MKVQRMVPDWLEFLSCSVVLLSILCAGAVVVDLFRHPQRMWIMALVWPLTALYAGPLGLWAYLTIGRRGQAKEKPFWQVALTGSTHCGAGCAVGDFLAEWIVFGFGGLVVLGSALAGKFLLAFALAYLFGLMFQFFSIAPMRGLGFRNGIIAAAKADTLSLITYEIGMFAWMAVVQLWLFPGLEPRRWTFWFMMQIAMVLGLATTFPMNWWLIRRGVKEAM